MADVSKDDIVKALQEERVLAKEDPWYLIENGAFTIKSKDGLIPLIPNGPQKHFIEAIKTLERNRDPIRIILLKARQEGMSTLIEALLYSRVSQNAGRNGLVLAHRHKATDNLFEMTKRYHDNLDEHLKPKIKKSNAKELIFEGLDSKIVVDTAENKEVGRSYTFHYVHLSECAFFPYYQETMLGLMQTVPNRPNTVVIQETTAAGYGTDFHQAWKDAESGKSGWLAVFLPWFDHKEYTLDFKDKKEQKHFLQSLTEEEEGLKTKFNLSYEQLNWRRWCIRENCGGDINKFRQEYPSYPDEAFLRSGRPVFNTDNVYSLLSFTKEPIFIGDVTDRGTIANPKGYIKIWEWPERGAQYVIGADVAEGLEKGDYSCAYVIKTNPQDVKIVASFHGHIDPHYFGSHLYKLGNLYNTAYIGVENNNQGISVNNKLIKDLKYKRFYFKRVRDELANRYTQKLGWTTSTTTKPLMISDLQEILNNVGEIYIPEKELLSEMLSFVYDAKGKMGAEGNTFDDRVIAFAIAVQMLHAKPYFTEPRFEPNLPPEGHGY